MSVTGLASPLHLALLALVVLLVFGGRRLPDLGRLAGRGIRSKVLGKPVSDPPPALPEPAPGPGAHPVVARQARTPALNDQMRAQAKRHVARSVMRRVPGPIGWIVRLLVR